jgi:hypothetical protein
LASGKAARRAQRTHGIPPDVLRPLQNIILLRENKELSSRYDVELRGTDRLKTYDRVECHIVFYPYSRTICSDDIHFYPFEEYVTDVLSNQRSAYAEIQSPLDQVFGLALGLLIALIFAHLKPASLLDIEAIVSVFGAYLVGKELWNDIERLLVNVSKNWRLRFQDPYYRYRLEKRTTLTQYSYLAKRQRYGKAILLPIKIDFIKQSNSQTLRMCFDTRDWGSQQADAKTGIQAQNGLGTPEPSTAHIHSIHVDPDLLDDLQRDGFMFGVKLSFGRRILGLTRSLEVFQSLNRESIGCLDDAGTWNEGAVFYRNTVTLGRLKLYLNKGLIVGQSILDVQSGRRGSRNSANSESHAQTPGGSDGLAPPFHNA